MTLTVESTDHSSSAIAKHISDRVRVLNNVMTTMAISVIGRVRMYTSQYRC
jgi:hypothetical protein